MLRYLASGLLTRNLARRVARIIPNPLLRTVAIAAVGYGVNRVVMRAGSGASTGTDTTGRRIPARKRGLLG
jgi:hypothetical protein